MLVFFFTKVGDRLNRDILGANRLGMRSVWLNEPKRQSKELEIHQSTIPIDHEIAHLTDLISTIKQINESPRRPRVRAPLVIGYVFPLKKIRKFKESKTFLDLYRADCSYVEIDMTRSIDEQGPFDVIVHKLTQWLVQVWNCVVVMCCVHSSKFKKKKLL